MRDEIQKEQARQKAREIVIDGCSAAALWCGIAAVASWTALFLASLCGMTPGEGSAGDVIGALTIFFGFMAPPMGLSAGVIALVFRPKGRDRKYTITGLLLCVIGLVWSSVVIWVGVIGGSP